MTTHSSYKDLRVIIWDDYDKTTFIADLTGQIQDRFTFSTGLHGGFLLCSLYAPMDVASAWAAYGTENFRGWYYYHLEVLEDAATVWEGRIVDVSIEWDAQRFGLGITAQGYWGSTRDQLYKAGTGTFADYSSGSNKVSDIIKEIVTEACPDLNGTADIDANSRDMTIDLTGTWRYPQDVIVDFLAPVGDSDGSLYFFSVYEDRKPAWKPRDASATVDWFVKMEDLSFGRLSRQGKHLRNHVKPFAGGTEGTATTDAGSTAGYPLRALVLEMGTGLNNNGLNDARDAAIADRKQPAQDQAFRVKGTVFSATGTAHRYAKPKYWVRAGETMRIEDLIPASQASPSLDSLRTFYIMGTEYNAITDELAVIPDRAPGQLTTLLARLGQLERQR